MDYVQANLTIIWSYIFDLCPSTCHVIFSAQSCCSLSPRWEVKDVNLPDVPPLAVGAGVPGEACRIANLLQPDVTAQDGRGRMGASEPYFLQ